MTMVRMIESIIIIIIQLQQRKNQRKQKMFVLMMLLFIIFLEVKALSVYPVKALSLSVCFHRNSLN